MSAFGKRAALPLLAIVAATGLAFAAGYLIAPTSVRPPREAAAAPETWTCSMHPEVRRDEPGRCPICGMALVRAAAPPEHDAARTGHGAVDAGILQRLGLREAEAMRETWQDTMRAPARLAFDERAQQLVQSRVGGFVTRLGPRAPGDVVRRGELVAEIYAPEAAAAWAEYQSLRRSGATDLAAAARTRLERLGVVAGALDAGAEPRFPVRAPVDGVVEALMVELGAAVTAGMPLMRLRDPLRLWAIAEVAETEWPGLDDGTHYELLLDARPERRLELRFDSTAPALAGARRTLELRFALVAPDAAMRPGMLGEVRAALAPRAVLAIPAEAVLRSAGREWVLRRVGEGRYAPRAVRIGARRDGRAEVLEGLIAGERIVASGQFLLDAEAYLARAFADLGGDAPASGERASHGAGGHAAHAAHPEHPDRAGSDDAAGHADHDHAPERQR